MLGYLGYLVKTCMLSVISQAQDRGQKVGSRDRAPIRTDGRANACATCCQTHSARLRSDSAWDALAQQMLAVSIAYKNVLEGDT